MLRYPCPRCGQLLGIPEQHLGKSGRCNRCGGTIVVKPGPPAAICITGVSEPHKSLLSLVARANGISIKGQVAKSVDLLVVGPALNPAVVAKAEERALSTVTPATFICLVPIKRSLGETLEQEPASSPQVDFLRNMGVPEGLATTANKWEASRWIDYLQAIRMEVMPVTERQLAFLSELGANSHRIAKIKSAAEASVLIDALLQERDAEAIAYANTDSANRPPSPGQIKSLWKWGVPASDLLQITTHTEASLQIEAMQNQAIQRTEIPPAVKAAASSLRRFGHV